MESRSLWFARAREVELRVEEVGAPHGDEVLVEALYSGISHGTEMLVYRGEVPQGLELDSSLMAMQGSFGFPIKYGYSSVGKVMQRGPESSSLSPGDVVFVHHPHQTHYVVCEGAVVKLPPGLPPVLGVFVANLETALNCLLDAGVRIGESVAIFGQGVVGLLISQLMRLCGVERIVTVDGLKSRREISEQLGADIAIDPHSHDAAQVIKELTGGVGADVVVEASGAPQALDDAIRSTAFEGLVVVVSWYGVKPVTLHLGNEFHRQRLTIRSSQVSHLNPALAPRWSMKRRMDTVLWLLSRLRLEDMISDTVPFDQAAGAFDRIDRTPEDALQVVLSYV